VGRVIDGQDKKVGRMTYNDTRPVELIEYLKPCLLEFVVHNFVTCWQKKEFKRFLKHILENTIISCIDFSENYALKVQNEIHDMHWSFFSNYNLNSHYVPTPP
jgi:hypothetical protein